MGDIIFVKFGDRVPADIRVLEARGFKVTVLFTFTNTNFKKIIKYMMTAELDSVTLKISHIKSNSNITLLLASRVTSMIFYISILPFTQNQVDRHEQYD